MAVFSFLKKENDMLAGVVSVPPEFFLTYYYIGTYIYHVMEQN